MFKGFISSVKQGHLCFRDWGKNHNTGPWGQGVQLSPGYVSDLASGFGDQVHQGDQPPVARLKTAADSV